MRITSNMILHNAATNINGNKVLVDKGNNQMTTQTKIQRPSEDPVVAVRSLALQTRLSKINQYYETNKEQVQERHKQYYQKNKDEINEQRKQRYQKNREKEIEQRKQRYQKNKDEINERRRQRYQKNREKELEQSRQRYQRKKLEKQLKEAVETTLF